MASGAQNIEVPGARKRQVYQQRVDSQDEGMDMDVHTAISVVHEDPAPDGTHATPMLMLASAACACPLITLNTLRTRALKWS